MGTLRYRQAESREMDWAYRLFKAGMQGYITQTWGWDETFQRHGFMVNIPARDFIIVSRNSSDIGGYCLKRKKKHMILEILLVVPEEQGQGLGTRIMKHIMRCADDAALPLQLSVLKCNPAARLYQRLGFILYEQDKARYRFYRPPASPTAPS